MSSRPNKELLYDSEATLRLVDGALADLWDPEAREAALDAVQKTLPATGAGLEAIPDLLLHAYAEIRSVHRRLQESRSLLQQATVGKIQHTGEKLREITSATEVAATDILDGLDRSLALVDELDREETEKGGELRGKLRDELYSLMGCLQFQDITAQQIGHASSMLEEIEERIAEIARLLDPAAFEAARPADAGASLNRRTAFDPAATTRGARHRQALADEIFGASKPAR